ncbi:hypothetical protein IJ843_02155 [bacterium]|nr:hypothetical protein [bacterium]
MNEKCTKFESLYLFRDGQELEEHLKECPDCRYEQEKMDKVSELLQEVKPYYARQRKRSFTRLKVACILCFGLFTGMLIGYFTQFGYTMTTASSAYSEETTNEYGMPVDSYGLISLN